MNLVAYLLLFVRLKLNVLFIAIFLLHCRVAPWKSSRIIISKNKEEEEEFHFHLLEIKKKGSELLRFVAQLLNELRKELEFSYGT